MELINFNSHTHTRSVLQLNVCGWFYSWFWFRFHYYDYYYDSFFPTIFFCWFFSSWLPLISIALFCAHIFLSIHFNMKKKIRDTQRQPNKIEKKNAALERKNTMVKWTSALSIFWYLSKHGWQTVTSHSTFKCRRFLCVWSRWRQNSSENNFCHCCWCCCQCHWKLFLSFWKFSKFYWRWKSFLLL